MRSQFAPRCRRTTSLGRAIVLMLGVSAVAAGCGRSQPRQDDPGPSSVVAEPDSATEHLEQDPLAATQRWTGDLDSMIARRRIRVLVTSNRTGYFFDGLRPRGITYDALVEFERDLNTQMRTRNLPVHVIHIPVARDRLLPMLLEGKGDLAVANLTITTARSERVTFSVPVVTGVSEVIVSNASGPPLPSLEALSGRELWVRASSSHHESLLKLNQSLRSAGRDTVRIRHADEHLETEDLLEMVNAGLIGLTVADSHLADFWSTVFDSLHVHRNLVVRRGGEIGWAFRPGSPKLERQVNTFLTRHSAGTAVGNELLRRYLRDNRWARNPTAGTERRRFRSMAQLFRRYAGQYDFDWLMIAAQAFQESKLQQGLVSPAGAVGVMQVLPTTAADPSVGVKHIEKLENNIHAGVKYMRFIHDQYLADRPLSELDRHLFAFACYNAGPRRIRDLRREAETMGLDPDVWFQNVEVVAAKRIGRETVQYVSNIFKYYLAYKLALEQEAPPAPGS